MGPFRRTVDYVREIEPRLGLHAPQAENYAALYAWVTSHRYRVRIRCETPPWTDRLLSFYTTLSLARIFPLPPDHRL